MFIALFEKKVRVGQHYIPLLCNSNRFPSNSYKYPVPTELND
jgi:hypothetical protein